MASKTEVEGFYIHKLFKSFFEFQLTLDYIFLTNVWFFRFITLGEFKGMLQGV